MRTWFFISCTLYRCLPFFKDYCMQICHGTPNEAPLFFPVCCYSRFSCIKKFFLTRQILKNFLLLSLDENFCTSSQPFFLLRDFFLKTGSGMLLPNWQKSSLLYGERWKHSSSASFGDLNRNLYNHYRMGNSEKSLRAAAESFMISRSIIVYNVGGWLFFIRWYLGQSGSVIRNFQASDNTGKQKLSGGVP